MDPPPPLPTTPARLGAYVAAVVITVVAILSQYFLPQLVPFVRPAYATFLGDLLVVYGIPVAAFAILVGAAPLRNWGRHLGRASVEGLRWYGGLSILSLGVLVILVLVYEAIDPSALALLNRPNPALQEATGNPWFFVGFSFIVGGVEETIFRGWVLGFWNGRTRSWLGPALGSSLLFAGVHLYYGTTYGVAAPLIFPSLFLTGLAFAAAYSYSGGNLLVVALLHGASDATAYLTLVNTTLGGSLHYLIILVGVVVAFVVYFQTQSAVRPPDPVPWGPAAPGAAYSDGEGMSSTQIPSGPS